MNKYRVHVWITTKAIDTRTDWKVFLANVKHSTKQTALLSCELCKTHKLSFAYVPFPAIVATSIVVVLQAPVTKAVVKTIFVQVYNTCVHHEPAMGN